jgi:hypothetical protein
VRPLAGAITDNRRERAVRRAAGGLWMTLYGAGSSSVVWGATEWPIALAIWGLVTAAMAFAGTRLLLEIRHIPGRQVGPRRFDRTLARNIAAVIAIYAIVESVSAGVLHANRQDDLIFPVAVGIVGLHFWLFARVLSTRQYYLTGAWDVLAVALTLGFTGPHARVGDISAWVFYPLAGNGVALFITAGLMLLESAKISRQLT